MQFGDSLSLMQRAIEKFRKLDSSDRVILLFGGVGVGKSSFVNYVAGDRRAKEGNGFYGTTTNSAYWDIEMEGRRLRMIDLPGSFDPGRNKVQDPSDRG